MLKNKKLKLNFLDASGIKNSGHLFLKCFLLSNSLKREKEGAWVFSTLKRGLEYYTMENDVGNLNSKQSGHISLMPCSTTAATAILTWLHHSCVWRTQLKGCRTVLHGVMPQDTLLAINWGEWSSLCYAMETCIWGVYSSVKAWCIVLRYL